LSIDILQKTIRSYHIMSRSTAKLLLGLLSLVLWTLLIMQCKYIFMHTS